MGAITGLLAAIEDGITARAATAFWVGLLIDAAHATADGCRADAGCLGSIVGVMWVGLLVVAIAAAAATGLVVGVADNNVADAGRPIAAAVKDGPAWEGITCAAIAGLLAACMSAVGLYAAG